MLLLWWYGIATVVSVLGLDDDFFVPFLDVPLCLEDEEEDLDFGAIWMPFVSLLLENFVICDAELNNEAVF